MPNFYELFAAFIIVFFPFIAIWAYYMYTGNYVGF